MVLSGISATSSMHMGTVSWRDPFNGKHGNGSWRIEKNSLIIRWHASTSWEEWDVPIFPQHATGLVHWPEFSLFRAQRLDRIHARDPTRGQITGRRRRRENAKRCGQISQWIEGADLEKQRRHEPRESDGRTQAGRRADPAPEEAAKNEHSFQRALLGAERQTDSDFPRFLRDGIGDYGVDPDDRQEERHAAADCEQSEREACPRHGSVIDLLHGPKLGDRKASVDGPDGLPNFGREAFRSGAGTAN